MHKLNKDPIYKNPCRIFLPCTLNVLWISRCVYQVCPSMCVYVTSPLMNELQVKAGIQEKDPIMSPLTITAENVTSATTTQVTKVTLQMIPSNIQVTTGFTLVFILFVQTHFKHFPLLTVNLYSE